MNLLKAAVGAALLPTAVGALASAAWTLGGVAARTRSALPFVLGLGCYAAFHFAVHRLTTLYVLGHELSHAFAAWMGGGRVLGMKVGSDGGHVDLSSTSAWIALAPYLIPVYAVGIVLVYRVLLWWAPAASAGGGAPRGGALHWGFLFLMGAALSFHIVQTAEALIADRQPDLRLAGGALFSVPLIALGNAAALVLALKCLFPGAVSLERSAAMAWEWTAAFWAWAADMARRGAAGAWDAAAARRSSP